MVVTNRQTNRHIHKPYYIRSSRPQLFTECMRCGLTSQVGDCNGTLTHLMSFSTSQWSVSASLVFGDAMRPHVELLWPLVLLITTELSSSLQTVPWCIWWVSGWASGRCRWPPGRRGVARPRRRSRQSRHPTNSPPATGPSAICAASADWYTRRPAALLTSVRPSVCPSVCLSVPSERGWRQAWLAVPRRSLLQRHVHLRLVQIPLTDTHADQRRYSLLTDLCQSVCLYCQSMLAAFTTSIKTQDHINKKMRKSKKTNKTRSQRQDDQSMPPPRHTRTYRQTHNPKT